jgi:hypothetical protein
VALKNKNTEVSLSGEGVQSPRCSEISSEQGQSSIASNPVSFFHAVISPNVRNDLSRVSDEQYSTKLITKH